MRNREQVIWDFVQEWIRKAELDFKAAEILLTVETDDYYPSAFHSQQTAEKYLKAYLVFQQMEFRKTHDLNELLTLSHSVDPNLQNDLESCVWLTPYGVEFRYPGDYPITDKDTAVNAFGEAQLVKVVITKRLQHYLSKGRPD